MHEETKKAPDFTAISSDGEEVKLSDYRGKWVVLYFYPRAFTRGCTREALRFKELYDEFNKLGVVVLGVSTDPPNACRKFSGKYGLPFKLISDQNREISKSYGVLRENGRTAERVTFVISPEGEIKHVLKGLKRPEAHAEEALRYLSQVSAGTSE